MNDLTTALLISVIGMGLVFAIILLLWGLIALVTRLGRRLSRSEPAQRDPALENKRLAAVVAVAAAMALSEGARGVQSEEMPVFPPPATASVSAWQAVTRAKTLNRKGPDR